MTKTINLDAPLCGLGDDYRPEIVWLARTGGTSNYRLDPSTYGICYTTKEACRRDANGENPVRSTVPTATRIARKQGLKGVILVDEAGTPVSKWPV